MFMLLTCLLTYTHCTWDVASVYFAACDQESAVVSHSHGPMV